MKLIKSLVFVLVTCHYTSCGWYFIGNRPQYYPNVWTRTFLGETYSQTSAYLMAFHWSLAQITPASMQVVPTNVLETIYTTFVILLAVVSFTSFIGGVSSSMAQLQLLKHQKESRDGMVRKFLYQHNVSTQVSSNVLHYLRKFELADRQRQLKLDDVSAFRFLPECILQDVRKEAFQPYLSAHPLVSRCAAIDQSSMKVICNECVKQHCALPDETLFGPSAKLLGMVFVTKGEFVYKQEQIGTGDFSIQPPDISIQPPGWCCEEVLWASNPMLSGKIAAGLCYAEAIIVVAETFQLVMRRQDHSLIRQLLAEYARSFILKFNCASVNDSDDVLFNRAPVVRSILNEICAEFTKGRSSTSDHEALINQALTYLFRRSQGHAM